MAEALTFKEAAAKILASATGPLEAKEITNQALKQGILASAGKTPENSMAAMLYIETKKPDSQFTQAGPGLFTLRSRTTQSQLSDSNKLKISFYPLYSELRTILPLWKGHTPKEITSLHSAIMDMVGSPQENEDWSSPDEWIPKRLTGDQEPPLLSEASLQPAALRLVPRFRSKGISDETLIAKFSSNPPGGGIKSRTCVGGSIGRYSSYL